MKTKEWLAGKKEWDFIRENNDIMSPVEMADSLDVTVEELTTEKLEMGIAVDDVSDCEYELRGFLNHLEQVYAWKLKHDTWEV